MASHPGKRSAPASTWHLAPGTWHRSRSELPLPHGSLALPVFMPDATQGVVRSVDSADLEACGVQAVVMNTFHLMQRPGSSTIQALGRLHRMTGWRRPIVTDSGGFQAYSLIRQNPRFGQLTDRGILFRPEGSPRKFLLTPERSIQRQVSYGADVVICLDDPTHVDDPLAAQQESVKRTIDWGRRCKAEFQRLLDQRNLPVEERPLLLGVIQGGGSLELRRQCAETLLEIGFDGFGYGGWPLDAEGSLLTELLAYTRELVPRELPMHALGVGHPINVAACAEMGYDLFDSAMPTRDARHGRLLRWAPSIDWRSVDLRGEWLSFLYLHDDKHIKNNAPISPDCDCASCARYSVGYLHHLFKINDSLVHRLATIHNLRFMTQLMERLRLRNSDCGARIRDSGAASRQMIGAERSSSQNPQSAIPNPQSEDLLAKLVETVRASPKYRRVSEDLIRHIGARELARRRSLKEALAATRNELHQVGGAYLDRGVRYQEWLAELRQAAQSGDQAALRPVCAAIMRHHSSTRERLPILEEFYTTTLGEIAPVRSILDVACGLNPLAIPWMPLAPDAEYYACDIYEDLIEFVNEFLALVPVRGQAEVADVTHAVPTRPVDVALILKTLPCLEQIDRSASLRLLETIPTDYLLVSFPVRSLGGRQKGMAGHYEAHFRELIAGKSWPVQRFEFATELAFLVRKGGDKRPVAPYSGSALPSSTSDRVSG